MEGLCVTVGMCLSCVCWGAHLCVLVCTQRLFCLVWVGKLVWIFEGGQLEWNTRLTPFTFAFLQWFQYLLILSWLSSLVQSHSRPCTKNWNEAGKRRNSLSFCDAHKDWAETISQEDSYKYISHTFTSNLSKRASLLKPFCLPFVPMRVCMCVCPRCLYVHISICLSVLIHVCILFAFLWEFVNI